MHKQYLCLLLVWFGCCVFVCLCTIIKGAVDGQKAARESQALSKLSSGMRGGVVRPRETASHRSHTRSETLFQSMVRLVPRYDQNGIFQLQFITKRISIYIPCSFSLLPDKPLSNLCIWCHIVSMPEYHDF